MSVHRNLKVRFYPAHGEWTCIVQRLGPDGMPLADVVSANGHTKEDAVRLALTQTSDADVQQILNEQIAN